MTTHPSLAPRSPRPQIEVSPTKAELKGTSHIALKNAASIERLGQLEREESLAAERVIIGKVIGGIEPEAHHRRAEQQGSEGVDRGEEDKGGTGPI